MVNDTKYLSTLVENLLYFVLDAMRYIYLFILDLRIIIVPEDCIIAWHFKSSTRVFLH